MQTLMSARTLNICVFTSQPKTVQLLLKSKIREHTHTCFNRRAAFPPKAFRITMWNINSKSIMLFNTNLKQIFCIKFIGIKWPNFGQPVREL